MGKMGVAKARTGFRGAFGGGESKMSPLGVLPSWKGEDLKKQKVNKCTRSIKTGKSYTVSRSEVAGSVPEVMLIWPISSVMAENLLDVSE